MSDDHSVGPQSGEMEISSEFDTRWIAIFSNGFNIVVLLSFVLLVTLWIYHLHTRDISQVPVVSAPDGPMRILPDDPGGKLADNQEFAVNSIVDKGSLNEYFDHPKLAPDSISLLEEDQPIDQMMTNDIEVNVNPIPENTAVSESHQNALNSSRVLSAEMNGLHDSSDVSGYSIEQGDRELNQNIDEIELPAVILSDAEPFVSTSLIPQLRPLKSMISDSPKPSFSDISTTSIPSGAQVVQLGAFPSADIAKENWRQLGLMLGDYLADKQPIVQSAVVGGRTFFRLRAAGFNNLDDARQFCSRLVADGVDCIPVIAR